MLVLRNVFLRWLEGNREEKKEGQRRMVDFFQRNERVIKFYVGGCEAWRTFGERLDFDEIKKTQRRKFLSILVQHTLSPRRKHLKFQMS